MIVDQFPTSVPMLMAAVFALGMRHGLDPDHLAAVDGLVRLNLDTRPRLSRWSGMLFSLGHGIVVMMVALVVGMLSIRANIPSWLEGVGAWISIALLLGLGVANLLAVLLTPHEQPFHLRGLRGNRVAASRLFRSPGTIVLIGALFAISFDTLSLAALFSLAAIGIGGWVLSAVLGACFTVGMMLTDGLNANWLARLMKRAGRRANMVSRVVGLGVAVLSIGVATLGAMKLGFHSVAAWSEANEGMLALAAIAFMPVMLFMVMRLPRRPASEPH
jgi:high-affinity nickel-transport protein